MKTTRIDQFGSLQVVGEFIFCDSDTPPVCKEWVDVDNMKPYSDTHYAYKDKNGHIHDANEIEVNHIRFL